MTLKHHLVISTGVTAIFSIWAKSVPALAACFLSGIFIDLDHHLDYFIVHRRIPLSYKKLYDFFSDDAYPKVFILFHSWEALAGFWYLIGILKLDAVWIGSAVGITAHMICDQMANPLKPLGYFLVYRIKNGFLKRKIMTDAYFAQQTK